MNAASGPPFSKRYYLLVCEGIKTRHLVVARFHSNILLLYIQCLSWQSSSSSSRSLPAGYCLDLVAPGSPLGSCPARRDGEVYWLLSVRSWAPVQFASPGTKQVNAHKSWYSGTYYTPWSLETRLDFCEVPFRHLLSMSRLARYLYTFLIYWSFSLGMLAK